MRSRSRRLTVLSSLFFFNDTATTEIYPLSLHDALPIWVGLGHLRRGDRRLEPRAHAPLVRREVVVPQRALLADPEQHVHALGRDRKSTRLNSSHLVISYAVFCLKKKKNYHTLRADSTSP